MQQRTGPNRVGPRGYLQSLADGLKLALKEEIIPALADKPVYVLAPILSAVPAFLAFSVIPFGPKVSHRRPRDGAAADRLAGRRAVRAGLLEPRRLRHRARRLVLAARPTRCSAGCARPRRSSATRSRWACRFVAVFLYAGSLSHQRDRRRAGEPLVRPHAAGVVRHLRHRDGRRDQPRALRPPRGRVRARRRLPHRVHVAEVRDVLPRRVHQHDHRLGARRRRCSSAAGARRSRSAGSSSSPRASSRWSGSSLKVLLFIFFFVWLRGTLPRMRYDQFMRLGWKVLIPVSLVWILLVAAIRTLTTRSSNRLTLVLIVVAVPARRGRRASRCCRRSSAPRSRSATRTPACSSRSTGAASRPRRSTSSCPPTSPLAAAGRRGAPLPRLEKADS